MKIYLSKYKTASTTHSEMMNQLASPQRAFWFPETYDRVKSGMFYVPHVLANKVVTEEMVNYVKQNPVSGKTGFILAGGSQGWAGGKSKFQDIENDLSYIYKLGMMTMTNVYAGRVASMFEAFDFVSTDATACASSVKVLMDVKNLIDNYGFDRVIVLALEDPVSNMTLEYFGQTKASISKADEEGGRVASAFDSVNNGFNVGQGAAFAIYESLNAVNKNCITPEAELIGTYTSAEDCTNPIGQRPDGQGYQRAITGALTFGNVRSKDIKLIKTHGTGTPTNNESEKNALMKMFNGEFIATSYKQHIGHTVAASGLLETGLILDDIKKGEITPIKNRTEKDTVFISEPTKAPEGLLLVLAAGMGNVYSAAIYNTKI
jgi:3-oxoacyl-(acyl-carrier-protein) synthase